MKEKQLSEGYQEKLDKKLLITRQLDIVFLHQNKSILLNPQLRQAFHHV